MAVFSEYEKQVWDYCMGFINNEYGVAGLLGNLAAESIITPGRIQGDLSTQMLPSKAYTQELNAGSIDEYNFVNTKTYRYNNVTYGPAYGLAQWDWSPRRQNYWNYWHTFQHGVAGSLEFELWFLQWELENQYASVLNVLKNATSVREASNKVLHDFENPQDASSKEEERYGYSQQIYDAYSGSPPTPPEPPTPTPSRKLPLFFYIRYPF